MNTELGQSKPVKPSDRAKLSLNAQGVTSVSQLSDVKPTDWAFTALQSLVERYGCIAGYPDSTFRGRQATSRYEFAAGLNACLDKINEIISAGLADKVGSDDIISLKKLQEEFATELATLSGRVDALDAKTTTLEAQQFSTTTK
ncbi:iron uptake porin, partial [Synechococcus sp. BA-132 BA5]|uniref:iron uptake porin n=1 Tax=Synechococcus sp. BA-132 BA5 TaxID=3110252 RepID=UPI002B1EF2BF